MAVNNIGVLTDANNARILDAIRYDASPDYQRRIPEATQAGIDAVLKGLTKYRPAYNEFESSLVNRIGMVVGRSKSWTNPLSEFKTGLLTFGDTIEEYQVGLLKAHNYDPDRDYMEHALFGRELPEVQTNFHRVNRQDFYKVTIQENLLRRAFLDDFGLSAFVSDFMSAPLKSDNWDEFLLTCRLFTEYEANGGFHKVNIPDVASLASTQDDARLALRKIRALAQEMTFISTHYNAAKMPTHANPEDMVLFATPAFQAAVDVEALAGAFNIDRAQIPHRIIPIPEEQFAIDGAQAVLTSKDFFIIADQRLENTSQFNPISAGTNYFWHHWQVISASRFVPAVLFTTHAGDEVITITPTIVSINSITLSDVDGKTATSVQRGMTYQAEATLTVDPANADARMAVTWSVLGARSARTRISQTGVLLVSPTEDASQLTIVAVDSNSNEPINELRLTVNVGVTGEETPEWPVVRPEDVDATEWKAATAYALNSHVVLSGGAILKATTAGTSGATEPTAPASVGATRTDNTVTWTRVA